MALSDIQFQVMWNRLLAVVEEQAQTLVRAAFSTSARESGDVSAGVFDLQGRMLAQAVTGTPGHVNSMAASIKHFLAAFPVETMREGDSYVTNDPWKATGHLSDFTVVSPAFHQGRLVALFACTTHVVDIGGQGQSPDGRQIYNEGLWIPPLHLVRQGTVDETLMAIIRQNVREPVQVEGDLYALVACNEIGAHRLRDMMTEYALSDLGELGQYIIDTTRAAMLKAIRAFPKGRAQASMTIDGYDRPVDLVATLTVSDDGVAVDYAGTSPTSDFGINCPKSYTDAYTAFGVKCIVAPSIPNNAGSLELIRVEAPEGCIVNAQPPCAVMARSIIGHMLPDVIFGCLHQIAPGRVPAEGTSCLWSVKLSAGHGIAPRPQDPSVQATPFTVTSFHSGGTGARPTLDGLSATPFPSGVRSVPIEVTEAFTPLVVWKKEFRSDSGGPGRYRGGMGQTMVIGNRERAPFAILATFDRTQFAPRGRAGGKAGALGALSLGSGARLKSKGRQIIPEGDVLVLEMPGGGGYGAPMERDPQMVLHDVRSGLVSREAARGEYGVEITADFQIDEAATARLRQREKASMPG
jgi:N-methylhydantoinase B/acetone carboxylase, alpha subunit